MESGLLLNVVIGESTAVLELLAGKDQALLIWRDSLLVLDARFDKVYCVRAFDQEGNGFPVRVLM